MNKYGNRQYHCKDCGACCVLKPNQGYTQSFRQQVLRTAREWVSLHGIERIFSPHRQTVLRWIEQYVAQLPVQLNDVLEVDEAWSLETTAATDPRGISLLSILQRFLESLQAGVSR